MYFTLLMKCICGWQAIPNIFVSVWKVYEHLKVGQWACEIFWWIQSNTKTIEKSDWWLVKNDCSVLQMSQHTKITAKVITVCK